MLKKKVLSANRQRGRETFGCWEIVWWTLNCVFWRKWLIISCFILTVISKWHYSYKCLCIASRNMNIRQKSLTLIRSSSSSALATCTIYHLQSIISHQSMAHTYGMAIEYIHVWCLLYNCNWTGWLTNWLFMGTLIHICM